MAYNQPDDCPWPSDLDYFDSRALHNNGLVPYDEERERWEDFLFYQRPATVYPRECANTHIFDMDVNGEGRLVVSGPVMGCRACCTDNSFMGTWCVPVYMMVAWGCPECGCEFFRVEI